MQVMLSVFVLFCFAFYLMNELGIMVSKFGILINKFGEQTIVSEFDTYSSLTV